MRGPVAFLPQDCESTRGLAVTVYCYAKFQIQIFTLCLIPLCHFLLYHFPLFCYDWFRYDRFRYAHFSFLKLYLIPLCHITLCPSPLWQVPRGQINHLSINTNRCSRLSLPFHWTSAACRWTGTSSGSRAAGSSSSWGCSFLGCSSWDSFIVFLSSSHNDTAK